MSRIRIEDGVPIPPSLAPLGGLPLAELELGQSAWIAADDPDERAHLRGWAERFAQAHSLATGRGYLVRSCRGGRGDTRGVRIWCTSIPAAFVPVSRLAGGDDLSLAGDPRARSPD